MQIRECFSALVAAGQGHRCQQIKEVLRDCLWQTEAGTSKVLIHKFGAETHPQEHRQIHVDLGKALHPIIHSIDPYFFGPDLKKKKL